MRGSAPTAVWRPSAIPTGYGLPTGSRMSARPRRWRITVPWSSDFTTCARREMLAAQPNAGHEAIAGLERDFEVEVLTQNVDDLHERAGSSKVTPPARRTDLPALVAQSRSGRPDRGVGAEARRHGARRGAAASAHRLFRRGGADVRTCRADCPDGGYHGGRGGLRWRSIPPRRWCAACAPESRSMSSIPVIPIRRASAIR